MKRVSVNQGDVYSRLTILREVGKRCNSRVFICKCECGKELEVFLGNLRKGNTKSCGCLHREISKEVNTSHGLSEHSLHSIWANMKNRCLNKKCDKYQYYGGRGITLCYQWKNFEVFYNDMIDGYKKGLSIDRIDNNGNYCKENCRWVTHKEQMRNTSRNRIYKGKCISQWCEELGLNINTVNTRINMCGWGEEKALEFKIGEGVKNK